MFNNLYGVSSCVWEQMGYRQARIRPPALYLVTAMAETRPILRSKNKSIDIREALELIENPETRAVTNLPRYAHKGIIYFIGFRQRAQVTCDVGYLG